jgi:hypothetical protein
MRCFIAILLISGYSVVARKKLYWSVDDDVHNAAVAMAMSRNRFDNILANLHCANNDELDTMDKFTKVRPVLESIRQASLNNFRPEQTLSVDESMVPYYGFHGCKQFI